MTGTFLPPGVFTECHRKDEERAQKLLTRVSEAWGRTTCLQLALKAEDMKFVSHGGIQVTLCGLACWKRGGGLRCGRGLCPPGGTRVPVLRALGGLGTLPVFLPGSPRSSCPPPRSLSLSPQMGPGLCCAWAGPLLGGCGLTPGARPRVPLG